MLQLLALGLGVLCFGVSHSTSTFNGDPNQKECVFNLVDQNTQYDLFKKFPHKFRFQFELIRKLSKVQKQVQRE